MKYLKLFENFDGEDPKWIVTSALDPIEVDEVTFDEKYGDTSMFRLFEFSEEPSEDKINHLKSWIEEEGYYSHKTSKGIIVTDKPIENVCIDWLNKNFSDMEKVESKDHPGCVLYRYNPGDNIIFYDKSRDRRIYVSTSIWSFFERYGFLLNIYKKEAWEWSKETIMNNWLNIDGKLVVLLNKGSLLQVCV
jgi:hypothetical protein